MTIVAKEPIVFSGFHRGVAYKLNTYGRPDPSVADPYIGPYTGIEIYAAKTFGLTVPGTRKVPHIGNDRLLKVQQFPTQEPITGEIGVGAEDLDLVALLGGSTIVTAAELRMLPHGSDLQGSEPNIGFIMIQDALAQSGPQRYRFLIIPSTKAVPRASGAGNDPIDYIYDLAPDTVNQHLWGEPLSILSDPSDPFSGVSESGADEAAFWDGYSEYEPRICSWLAQAAQVAFTFPEDKQAADTDKIAVWTANGTTVTEITTGITKAVTGVTFDTAPVTTYGAGTEVHVLYQKS